MTEETKTSKNEKEERKGLSEAEALEVYDRAVAKMKEGRLASFREAISLFSEIPGVRDADLQATRCFQQISKIKSNRKKTIDEISKDSIIVAITVILMVLVFNQILPGIRYSEAEELMEAGNYEGAEGILKTLGSYGDSEEKLEVCETYLREESYEEACELYEEGSLARARTKFEELGDFKDSAVRAAEIMDFLYARASSLYAEGDLEGALETFTELDGYLDSEIKAEEIREEIREKTGKEPVIADENRPAEETETDAEKDATDQKLQFVLIILAAFILVLCLAAIPFYARVLKPLFAYRKGIRLMDAGSFEEALIIFRDLEDYRDSKEKAKECQIAILDRRYEAACQRKDAEEYEEAIRAFTALNGYRDSLEMIRQCREAIFAKAYGEALALKEDNRFEEAAEAFNALKGYRDSAYQVTLCRLAIEKEPVYREAVALLEKDERKAALALFTELRGYRDSSAKIRQIRMLYYQDALKLMKEKHYPEAISAFAALEGFKDSSSRIMECRELIQRGKYEEAKFLMGQEEYEAAIDILRVLRDYEDSKELLLACKKNIHAPRPFHRLKEGMTAEEVKGGLGECLKESDNRKTGRRELVFGGARLMDATGYVTAELTDGLLSHAVWSADFCWEPYETDNDGLFPGIEYAKYRDYYTYLFGECTSEYLKDNHKGSWWRNPEITVDVCGYDYVTIHFAFTHGEEKTNGKEKR